MLHGAVIVKIWSLHILSLEKRYGAFRDEDCMSSAHLSVYNIIYHLIFQLSGDLHIVIAKMDATANDIPPSYDVQG